MSDPIPDEVLRDYAEWGAGPATDMMTGALCTDHLALQWLLGAVRLTARDLARELLALREASRFAWGGLKDIEEGRDGPGEKWCAEACRNIEALLPEEPK